VIVTATWPLAAAVVVAKGVVPPPELPLPQADKATELTNVTPANPTARIGSDALRYKASPLVR
jgi:hypothetical protein